ncbi:MULTISPECIES: N-acetylmuramoyl-L-alanine amidase [Mammaliicoccus]|uniref:N-acetylmuramoyl-L-alanine amidase n=1 Tax=Mammaliicoccus TaxID=2803850 RepID=UPI001EFB19DC|nr:MULTISPECIES: N-acetylmuramoyl-L-alanine amidase [unclassified Mammaliicoccus]
MASQNDYINYSMDKREKPLLGVVVHNDASELNANEWREVLKDAPEDRYIQGIAHYYIDRNYQWQAIDTENIAWHTANEVGNEQYIGYEVLESLSSSDEEFLINEQETFRVIAADMTDYNLMPNRDTVRLHLEFSETECPHRSLEMHTNWRTTVDGIPDDWIINEMKDYFIEQIKQYMLN